MNYLPESDCTTRKQQFLTKELAKAELEKISLFSIKNHTIPVRSYKCDYCDRFHLTSKTMTEYKQNKGEFSLNTYLDVDFDKYLSNDEYVSNSMLKKLSKSPAHLLAYLNDEGNKQPSAALTTGRAAHAYILERQTFDDQYFIMPDDLKSLTKPQLASIEKGKPTALAMELSEKWNNLRAEARGRELIKASSLGQVDNMRNALMSNPKIKALLSVGKAEQTRFFIDEATGVKCKMRADFVHGDSQSVIVDYKTCEDARPEQFAKSVITYGYDIQATHYKNGGIADHFYIIAQEKTAPYAAALYLISSEWLVRGEKLRRHYLETYAKCLATGEYPSYPTETQTMELPRWAEID